MNKPIKNYFQFEWFLKHGFTITSCVLITVLGIVFLAGSSPESTTIIGEDISTRNLTVSGTLTASIIDVPAMPEQQFREWLTQNADTYTSHSYQIEGMRMKPYGTADHSYTNVGLFTWGEAYFTSVTIKNKATGVTLWSEDFSDMTIEDPPAGWTVVAGSWVVREDATSPSGRVLSQETAWTGNHQLILIPYQPSVAFTIEAQIKPKRDGNFVGFDGYVEGEDNSGFVMGSWTTAYPNASARLYYNNRAGGGSSITDRAVEWIYPSSYTPALNTWYLAKASYYENAFEYSLTPNASTAYRKVLFGHGDGAEVTVFEQSGSGLITGLLFGYQGEHTTMPYIKIYYDGESSPTINVPLSYFMMIGKRALPASPFFSRFLKYTDPPRNYYRQVYLPYQDGIKIKITSGVTQASDVILVGQIEYVPNVTINGYNRLKVAGSVEESFSPGVPQQAVIGINEAGTLDSIFVWMESSGTDANGGKWLEVNWYLWKDDSVDPIAQWPGTDTIIDQLGINSEKIGDARYFDYTGQTYLTDSGPPYKVGFYRLFHKRPVTWSDTLELNIRLADYFGGQPNENVEITAIAFYYIKN